ncbi:MAG: hypothetical protein AAGA68_07430 [Pseudomonadota bacterium]
MKAQSQAQVWSGLRREAKWAGAISLLLAPLVFVMFATQLGTRDDLRYVRGELGVVERSGRWVQFVLDEKPPPVRYSARLGRSRVLVDQLLASKGAIACLVDERNYAWELTIDGELFVSFEYAQARLRGDRMIGWSLATVLVLAGGVLLWYSRRLPVP